LFCRDTKNIKPETGNIPSIGKIHLAVLFSTHRVHYKSINFYEHQEVRKQVSKNEGGD
jgi:hypothetical protein